MGREVSRMNYQREIIHREIYQNSYTKFFLFDLLSLCQFNFTCGDIKEK